MVYFQTKTPYLGRFWWALEKTMLVHIFNGHTDYFRTMFHGLLVYFLPIW
jgi:hypothetical protein